MREQSQQTVYRQVQQDVNDDGDDDWQQQRVSLICARAGNNTSERTIEGIGYCNDKLHEPGRAPRGHQGKQKSQAKQGVKNEKQVVDDLRNTRETP